MWILRSVSAEDAPVTFRLLPGYMRTIGRSPAASLVVDAPLISRVHCRLTVSADGRVEVVDLDSTNGTWVNGSQIAAATLHEGAVLRVGRVEFILEREASRESAAAAPEFMATRSRKASA